MVPLAQMRTLIFLLACGALAEKPRSNTTSLLPQPPGPRQGDPDRHGIGDGGPTSTCGGMTPKCTAVPVQHGMCLIIDGTAASSNSDRAVPDGRVLMSVALPFAVIFMIALGVNALITDHPREKPPRGPAIVYAATRTNHLGIDMPSGCKYRHRSAADSTVEALAAAAVDLATMAKYLVIKTAIIPLAAMIMALYTSGALIDAVYTIALECCCCILCFALDGMLASACWLFGASPEKEDSIDSAFMMSSATAEDDWDARKYPMCPPYSGKRGVAWDSFVRDFGAAAAGKGDDENSMEETMLGEDVGGDAPGALPGGGVAQVRRRAKRLRELYAQLYKHIPDPRLQRCRGLEAGR